jgi:hypothetical protein
MNRDDCADVVNFTYTGDAGGNIVSQQYGHRSNASDVYAYDALDRVTGAGYHTATAHSEQFNDDILGNRKTYMTVTDSDTSTYAYAGDIARHYNPLRKENKRMSPL